MTEPHKRTPDEDIPSVILKAFDLLESKIKTTIGGKIHSRIWNEEEEYNSSKKEDILGLSLDVKGCFSLEESLNNYTRIEVLDGDNQYNIEGYAKVKVN